MFEKLREVESRYEEIAQKLTEPEVFSDQNLYRTLMREHKNLSPIVEKYRAYEAEKSNMNEARALLSAGGLEKDFREMVEEELEASRERLEGLAEELKFLLLPRDPNDDRSVIVEIRGGAGGEEAALFAGVLYRMYSMYAESRRWKTEILSANETELGGYKEISFSISGEGAYSRLKYESGVHRVQRVPETEASGRIHTSTATVAVLPEAEDVDFELDPATHLPTGTVVECQDERSQHKNRDRAMKILRSRIYESMRREQDEKIASERRSQVGTGDRSERIRTYNYPQGRVTDHRIGLTLYRIEYILNGDLDEIIDSLITADRAEKLKAQNDL